MKITRIEICNFRGFPGPGKYTFDLGDGRNLLLYGDNGSGKSSLFQALDHLFVTRFPDEHKFDSFLNVFAKDEGGAPVTSGSVRIALSEGSPGEVCWHSPSLALGGEQLGRPPWRDIRVRDAALRRGCLEYR